MPRLPRLDAAGALHHVYARGVARQSIFADELDFRRYLGLLGNEVRNRAWRCLAYCLMPNHVHVVMETPKANLAAGMQRLHGSYGRAYNDRHERVGHLFQGRYGSVLVRDDAQLWQVVGYLARNPIQAGLCADAGAWRWSSFGPVVTDSAPSWIDRRYLFELLAAAGGDAARRYAELALPAGVRPL